MQELYEGIRKDAEEQGYSMTDEKFTELVRYAERKAAVAGKDESYIPYLLPDVIKEYFIRKLIYDALNGVAWYDDNAIVDTQVRKFYSDTPRVDVFIRAVE